MLQDFLTQVRCVDMGVDLSRGDGLMPQHGLDGMQVGSSFQQAGGPTYTSVQDGDVWHHSSEFIDGP